MLNTLHSQPLLKLSNGSAYSTPYFASWYNAMLWAGLFCAAGLLSLGIGAMVTLGLAKTDVNGFWSSLFDSLDHDRVIYALKSASVQAGLSAFLSLIIAIPSAIAVSRRPYWPMMRSFTAIISLAMVLPTTVAALGLLSVWGRQGVIIEMCRGLGVSFCDDFTIYGLHGVALAHMMLNIPLMIRVFIPLLEAIPARKHHLSVLLSLGIWGRFRHVELPHIKPAIPGVMALVFLLCFTSFALVLMLGGGPKVTTLEVEIYSAVRFDFNLAAAAGLSIIQFFCAAIVVLILSTQQQFDRPTPFSTQASKKPHLSALERTDLGWREMALDLFMVVVLTDEQIKSHLSFFVPPSWF